MASSVIEICNMALALVGQAQISAFNDASDAERQCETLYSLSRDAVLRAHPWNFAEKYASIAASVTTPTAEFDYYYPLPSDCIRVLRLIDTDASFRIVENRRIATDATSPLKIAYTSKITDTAQFDPLFTQAVAYYLGAQLSIVLSDKTGLHSQLMKYYDDIIRQAKTVDGQEGTPLNFKLRNDWRKNRTKGRFSDDPLTRTY